MKLSLNLHKTPFGTEERKGGSGWWLGTEDGPIKSQIQWLDRRLLSRLKTGDSAQVGGWVRFLRKGSTEYIPTGTEGSGQVQGLEETLWVEIRVGVERKRTEREGKKYNNDHGCSVHVSVI